jgi:O-antigen/teichoic acid export membrane protein
MDLRLNKFFSVLRDFLFFGAQSRLSDHFRRLGQEFFWVGLGQGAALIGGLFGVRLLTGVLNPVNYGELALGLTIATFSQQLILGPLTISFTRFFPYAWESGKLRIYFKSVIQLLTVVTAAICIFAVVGGSWLKFSSRSDWLAISIVAVAFSLVAGFNTCIDGMQNAARQRKIVAFHQGIGAWLRPLAAVGLVILLGNRSVMAMSGYVLAAAVIFLSQLHFLRRIILPKISLEPTGEMREVREWVKRTIGYAWPFACWGVFTWLQSSSDRWALQLYTGTNAVGLYAVLYQLGYYPVQLLSNLMIALISPVLYARAGDATDPSRMYEARRLNQWIIIGMLILTVMGTLLAFVLKDNVFHLLAAPQYWSVSVLMPWMVAAGGFFATGQVASVSLMLGTRTTVLIAPKITTAILGISLNLLGASKWGLKGVVFAQVAVTSVYFGWVVSLASLTAVNKLGVQA